MTLEEIILKRHDRKMWDWKMGWKIQDKKSQPDYGGPECKGPYCTRWKLKDKQKRLHNRPKRSVLLLTTGWLKIK